MAEFSIPVLWHLLRRKHKRNHNSSQSSKVLIGHCPES